jgi:hypothetical protein
MNLFHPINAPSDYPGPRFLVNYDIAYQAEELRISKLIDGEMCHGVLTFEKHNPRDMTQPTMRFPDGENDRPLQHLFDALWNAGFRPPKVGNASEIIQVKDDLIEGKDSHLHDLRRLLFKTVGIEP